MSKIATPTPLNAVKCRCGGSMRHVDRQPYFCADCGAFLQKAGPSRGNQWEIHWGWLVEVEAKDSYVYDDAIGLEWTFHFELDDHENDWVILANGSDLATAQATAEGYVKVYLRRIFSGPTWAHYFKGLRLSDWEEGAPDDTCLWGEALDGRAFVWSPRMPEVSA